MPGCIQPMSSPMMKRMLGFGPWAEAGALAMVVAVHKTTRAPEITLNMLMVASLDVGCRNPGRSLCPTPPTDHFFPIQDHASGCGRVPCGPEGGRSALDALCGFGSSQICLRVALQRGRRQFTEGGAICHCEAPKLQELVASSDLSYARF